MPHGIQFALMSYISGGCGVLVLMLFMRQLDADLNTVCEQLVLQIDSATSRKLEHRDLFEEVRYNLPQP